MVIVFKWPNWHFPWKLHLETQSFKEIIAAYRNNQVFVTRTASRMILPFVVGLSRFVRLAPTLTYIFKNVTWNTKHYHCGAIRTKHLIKIAKIICPFCWFLPVCVCVCGCVCAHTPLSIHNSAVTAWISGSDMVERPQGELLPLLSHLLKLFFTPMVCSRSSKMCRKTGFVFSVIS